jgi:large subunit ribosomal protein L10
MLAEGKTFAFNLAVETGIMTPETVEPILARAHSKAMALASQIPDALTDELREKLAGVAAAAPAAVEAPAEETKPDEEGDKDDEEEEKVSEEDAAAGLSALFG